MGITKAMLLSVTERFLSTARGIIIPLLVIKRSLTTRLAMVIPLAVLEHSIPHCPAIIIPLLVGGHCITSRGASTTLLLVPVPATITAMVLPIVTSPLSVRTPLAGATILLGLPTYMARVRGKAARRQWSYP